MQGISSRSSCFGCCYCMYHLPIIGVYRRLSADAGGVSQVTFDNSPKTTGTRVLHPFGLNFSMVRAQPRGTLRTAQYATAFHNHEQPAVHSLIFLHVVNTDSNVPNIQLQLRTTFCAAYAHTQAARTRTSEWCSSTLYRRPFCRSLRAGMTG